MSTSRRNQPSNLTGYPWPGSQAQYYTGTGTPRGNAVDFLSGTLANVNIQDQSYRPNAAAYTQSSAYGPFRGGAGGGSAYHYQNIPNNVGGQTHMYAPTAYSPRDNLGHVDSSARQEGKGLKEKNRERDAIRDKASSSRKQSFESGNSPPDTHYLDGYDPFYQFSSMDPTTAATSSLNYPSSLVTTTATTFQGGESSYSPQASQGAADVSFSSPQTSTAGSRNYQVDNPTEIAGLSYARTLSYSLQNSTTPRPFTYRNTRPESYVEEAASTSFTNPSLPTESFLSPEVQLAISQSHGFLTGSTDGLEESNLFSSSRSYSSDPYRTYEEEQAGDQTPRASSPVGSVISRSARFTPNTATAGHVMSNSNILDERYVVQPSAKFSPGEVFKIYWSEPLGAGRTQTATEYETRSHLGQKFYFGFRRFIVIANDEGHCTCVPILTYEQRGCTKRGVKPSKHGIVYAKGGQPLLLEREPNLGFDPVQLVLDYGTEKIAKESRINYAKLVTVEHNVKVFFIGRIVQSDFVNIVTGAVDKCWMVKNRR